MIITANNVNYAINAPQYDYVSTIMMGLIHTELMPKGYGIWDNSDTYDFRRCKCNLLLNATQTDSLLGIFNDVNKGRGISVTLKLGRNSGFYPYGPDHGDSGNFQSRMISIVPSPVLEEPHLYFNTTIEFIEESNPSYSLPAEQSEGNLQIGTIAGLRYPPEYPKSSTDYGFSTQITTDGSPYTIDKTNDADYYVTTLPMVCSQNKAAALINHMMGTVRANNVNVISQANNYLFGREGGSNKTYVCQWLNEIITIKCPRYDEFNFDLIFYMVSN